MGGGEVELCVCVCVSERGMYLGGGGCSRRFHHLSAPLIPSETRRWRAPLRPGPRRARRDRGGMQKEMEDLIGPPAHTHTHTPAPQPTCSQPGPGTTSPHLSAPPIVIELAVWMCAGLTAGLLDMPELSACRRQGDLRDVSNRRRARGPDDRNNQKNPTASADDEAELLQAPGSDWSRTEGHSNHSLRRRF